MPVANNSRPMTDEQAAAQTALTALKIREARGERIAQSVIADAIRWAAEADYEAQHTKTWKSTP